MLIAAKRLNKNVENIDFGALIHLLWILTVSLSAVKNAVIWDFFKLEDSGFLKVPVFEDISNILAGNTTIILYVSLASLLCFIFKNRQFHSIPFLINGVANFLLQISDYLALHHDMLLSFMLFTAYGMHLISEKKSWKDYTISIVIAITASTYFISGFVKINFDFLSGEMAKTIIERANIFFYWPFLKVATYFSVPLAWFAMLVELIEPILLVFFAGHIKLIIMLFAFPLHIGILLTGTGTVYNLIYPAAFLLILRDKEISKSTNKCIRTLYNYMLIIFVSFAFIYTLLMFYIIAKNIYRGI
jgi:hypothetical protein